MAENEFEMRNISPESGRGEHLEESAADVASVVGAAASVGALGFSAAQAFYARASYLLQRDAVDEYDPGFSEQIEPVLDLTLDGESHYGPGGQEYYPGFEDLDY